MSGTELFLLGLALGVFIGIVVERVILVPLAKDIISHRRHGR